MNRFTSKHKQANARKVRELHINRPKEFWRYLNRLKPYQNSEMPSVEAFYNNFKEINSGMNRTVLTSTFLTLISMTTTTC